MLKRQIALSQLNLLRHADNSAVRATAETVLWLEGQLQRHEVCYEQYRNFISQYRNNIKDVDCAMCCFCTQALQDLVENRYENI